MADNNFDINSIPIETLKSLPVNDLKLIRSGNLKDVSLPSLKSIRASMTPVSASEAAGQGLLSGLALGAAPLATGAGEVIGGTIGDIQYSKSPLLQTLKESISKIPERFKAGRQERIAEETKLAEQQPLASIGGRLAGALATAPLTAAKGALGAFGVGAGLGATEAVAEKGIPTSLEEAKNIAVPATISGVINTALGPGGSKALSYVGGKAEDLGKALLFKSIGAKAKDIERFLDKPVVEENLARVANKFNLVGAGKTVADVFENSKAALDDVGSKIGGVYKGVLDKITDSARLDKLSPEVLHQIENSGFKPLTDKKALLSMLDKELKGPGSSAAMSRLSGIVDDIGKYGDQLTPQDALKIKGQLDDLIDYGKSINELPIFQQGVKKLRDFVNKKTLDQVDLIDKVFPSGDSQALKELNKDFGGLSDIFRISKNKVSREEANRFFSLPENLLAGSALGGGISYQLAQGKTSPEDFAKTAALGVGTGVLGKLGRTYGPGVSKLMAEKLVAPLSTTGSQLAPYVAPAITETGTNAIQRRLENARNR